MQKILSNRFRNYALLSTVYILKIFVRNTYDISIRPYEDCCTIFVPEHPVINPVLEKAREYEKAFDYEALVEDAIKSDNVIKVPLKQNEFDNIL